VQAVGGAVGQGFVNVGQGLQAVGDAVGQGFVSGSSTVLAVGQGFGAFFGGGGGGGGGGDYRGSMEMGDRTPVSVNTISLNMGMGDRTASSSSLSFEAPRSTPNLGEGTSNLGEGTPLPPPRRGMGERAPSLSSLPEMSVMSISMPEMFISMPEPARAASPTTPSPIERAQDGARSRQSSGAQDGARTLSRQSSDGTLTSAIHLW
jgi:hypothetical protein